MPVGSKMVVYSDGTNINLVSLQKGYYSISSAYTAVDGDQLIIDTSSTFIDAKGTFGSNNLTVGRNSSNINGAASDLTVSTNGAAFTLVYLNATRGWSYKDKI
jgi:hypothetical protein